MARAGRSTSTLAPLVLAWLVLLARPARAAVVHIDVAASLDADVIVNGAPGPIDPTQLPVDDGLAGGDYCLLTQSAAAALWPADPDGLPDTGLFPASALHPEVQLAYRNGDDGSNARRLIGAGSSVTFAVPPDSYGQIHLFLLSGSGRVDVTVRLGYSDSSSDLSPPVGVPDWFDDPADTPGLYRLFDGMDRVKSDGASDYEDFDDPALFGLRADPDPGRTLVSVTLTRASGTLAVLNFFGATGVTGAAPPPPTVYESADPASVVLPGNAVGTATASPFDHVPAALPRLFYQVTDGNGAPAAIKLVEGGPGLRVYF